MSSTFTRGIPLHARIYDAVCEFEEKRGLLEWRRRLVGGLTGDVLEIATGTGRNLPHYPSGVRVTATEFDPVMFASAVDRAKSSPAEVTLCLADGTLLPFADGRFDAVVIGLALCSIPDPSRALQEVRRVLKPEGRFRFIEHVRADDGSLRGRIQDAVNPAWRTIVGGCNCNRRTTELVLGSGFDFAELDRFKSGLPLIAPHVYAEARPR